MNFQLFSIVAYKVHIIYEKNKMNSKQEMDEMSTKLDHTENLRINILIDGIADEKGQKNVNQRRRLKKWYLVHPGVDKPSHQLKVPRGPNLSYS